MIMGENILEKNAYNSNFIENFINIVKAEWT